ncbi:MAG: hypothetical protein RIC93_05620, partial [Alphaproteobacteria bacterium]
MKSCSAASTSFFGGWLRAALALSLSVTAGMPAMGQVSNNVDRSLLDAWRLTTGNTIRFCQYDASPTLEFDRALAEAA